METSSSPWTLPTSVLAVFNHFHTGEFATYTKARQLSVIPVTPLWDEHRQTVVITTATALAQKAYHVKRNPLVSILLSEPFASGVTDAPAVLVQGRAVVSEDLEGKRLFQFRSIISEKVSEANYRKSPIMRRLMDWYYVRLIIDIVPHRMFIWEHGDWSQEPTIIGPALPAYPAESIDIASSGQAIWKRRWATLAATYDSAIVTMPGPDVYPLSFRGHFTAQPQQQQFVIDPVLPLLTRLNLPPSIKSTVLFHQFGASMKQSTLRQFQLLGNLSLQDHAALLAPTRMIPAANSRSSDHPVGFERLTAWPTFIRKGKRDAKRYQQKRTFRQPVEMPVAAE